MQLLNFPRLPPQCLFRNLPRITYQIRDMVTMTCRWLLVAVTSKYVWMVSLFSTEARGKNPNQLMYHCNTSQSDTDFRRLKYCQGKEANPIRVCNSNRDKCLSQNAFFHQPPNTCYSRSLGIYVRNQRLRFSDFAELPLPFGTKVAWLVFSFANTSCYKMMDDKVWYFYRGCNSETVLDRILKEK